jgi:hypothetical protein
MSRLLPHRSKIYFLSLIIFLQSIFYVAKDTLAYAQSSDEISFLHTPVQTIPDLGNDIIITVQLHQTKRFEHNMLMYLVRDNLLSFIPFGSGTLDMNDVPTFTTSVTAPVQSMSYYFQLTTTDGRKFFSPKYNLSRSCKTVSEPINILQPLPEDPNLQLKELKRRVHFMGVEMSAYERSLVMMDELKNLIDEIANEKKP